ncbi:MAG: tail fiber protein [Nitrospirae bacterium]|nr:tail fiber protein [Nitrospirota bacterium]
MKTIIQRMACYFLFIIVGASPQTATAGTEPFIGEIMMTAASYCPVGWTDANGQLLAVPPNQALFSLLGTTFGGNGRTTFGLPDLRGRVAIHSGQGPGLTDRKQGNKGGMEQHTLTVNEMPKHTHNLMAAKNSATSRTPTGRVLATPRRNIYASSGSSSITQMSPTSIGTVGNGQPHNNMQPFLTIRYCIALQGIYPSRN